MYLARRDDVVLVPERPSREFLSARQAQGFDLPEFEVTSTGVPDPFSPLRTRKLGEWRPWLKGPEEAAHAAALGLDQEASGDSFDSRKRTCFSKAWSARFLREWLETSECCSGLIDRDAVGREVSTLAEASAVIATWRNAGWHRLVVKREHGFAGQNALRLWEPEVLAPQWRWIQSSLAGGRLLVIEPWLDRVVEFSVQCEARESGLEVLGYTGLKCDHRGQFEFNWAGPDFAKRPPREVLRELPSWPPPALTWPAVFARLGEALGPRLRELGYRGAVGIDAFVFRDRDGVARVKPVVEINPRYTMGRVTLELMRFVAPGSRATLRLKSAREAQKGGASLADWAREEERRLPVRLKGTPKGRIAEGFVPLTDPTTARRTMAGLWVEARD